jgi:hypothetical protein
LLCWEPCSHVPPFRPTPPPFSHPSLPCVPSACQADAAAFTYAQVFANLQACPATNGAPAPPPAPGPAPTSADGPSCFGFVRDQCCPNAPQQCVCAGGLCAYTRASSSPLSYGVTWQGGAPLQSTVCFC